MPAKLTQLTCFALATSWLIAAPVQAQQPNSTPSPSSVVSELSDAAQTLGAAGFVAAVLSLALIALIVGAGMFFWKGLSPLLKTIESERQAREQAQANFTREVQRSTERENAAAELRTQQADALERTAGILSELETKSEAQKRRDGAVKTINEHTSTQINPLKDAVDKVGQDVEAMQQTLEQKASKADLDNGLKPVLDELTTISKALDNIKALLISADETPASAPPSSPVTSDPPDVTDPPADPAQP